mmetsp:Transcript_44005/g.104722  ORF Transcript_44005/g.104722 Transcript_44005/m.104722 type:complete len:275 (-) Transcript_44005:757-1581(-)
MLWREAPDASLACSVNRPASSMLRWAVMGPSSMPWRHSAATSWAEACGPGGPSYISMSIDACPASCSSMEKERSRGRGVPAGASSMVSTPGPHPMQMSRGVEGTCAEIWHAAEGVTRCPMSASACSAAPITAASSGAIAVCSSTPGSAAWRSACTRGIRDDAPTSSICARSAAVTLALARAASTTDVALAVTEEVSSSNFAREIETEKSMPSCALSTSILVLEMSVSCFLARSHPTRSRAIDREVSEGSILCFFLNCSAHHLRSTSSMQSPPNE